MLACMLSGFSRAPRLATVSTAEQSESVTHTHVDSPCCKAPCWTDLTTARQVAFPELHRKFLLVAYFIRGVNPKLPVPPAASSPSVSITHAFLLVADLRLQP